MWGILPIGSSILALLLAFIPEKKFAEAEATRPSADDRNLVLGRLIS
jgi:hypothetical protein